MCFSMCQPLIGKCSLSSSKTLSRPVESEHHSTGACEISGVSEAGEKAFMFQATHIYMGGNILWMVRQCGILGSGVNLIYNPIATSYKLFPTFDEF